MFYVQSTSNRDAAAVKKTFPGKSVLWFITRMFMKEEPRATNVASAAHSPWKDTRREAMQPPTMKLMTKYFTGAGGLEDREAEGEGGQPWEGQVDDVSHQRYIGKENNT